MNELHKYATFSIDLTGTPERINSMFSIGRARIFYKGMNRNRSIIDGEVAEQLASTIPGTPVIGTYNYEKGDFEGHEEYPCAFGFIPLDPNISWATKDDKEYLEVDVVIWDGRFEEAESILRDEKHLSMELNPTTMKGAFKKIGGTTYYNITYAEFAGITVLGDDTEPCFEDAQFITAYSKMVNAYALYIEEQTNNKGGKSVMDNITEVVEPEVTTEEVVEETIETEATEEVIEVEEVAEPAVEPEVETEEEAVEETEIVETVEDAPEAAEDYDVAEEDLDKLCPECGKNPCVCKSSSNEEESEEADEEDDEDKEESQEEKYQALQAKYESLENKYNEALNSLNKYTRKEKLEIINKFSTKIESEELIEELTNKVDEMTTEEIKSELGQALVEQMSAEDAAEEASAESNNFSLNINIADNNLGNTAWDLVKRHKANK